MAALRWIGTLTGTAFSLIPWLGLIAAGLIIVIIAGQRFGIFGETVQLPANSVLVPEGESGRSVESFTLTARDAIRPIDNPRFISSAEATSQMLPTEVVIGLAIDGEAKAYQVNMLSQHEIVNDTVGGRPVAVTF